MNSNIQLLVDALRSGEYEQTEGTLENNKGNCCLGVACREYIKAGNSLEIGTTNNTQCTTFNGEHNFLPIVVQEWLGMKVRTDVRSSIQTELIDMNDNGSTFIDIADFIVANEELFSNE